MVLSTSSTGNSLGGLGERLQVGTYVAVIMYDSWTDTAHGVQTTRTRLTYEQTTPRPVHT